VQNEIAEGQKRQQRHIVRDKHRADKGDVYESENAELGVPEFANYRLCQSVEKADISERAHDGKHAKKTGERLKIEIAEILSVGSHDKGRNQSRDRGNKRHSVSLYKRDDSLAVDLFEKAYNFSLHIPNLDSIFSDIRVYHFFPKNQ
jgi:hypothetical protein